MHIKSAKFSASNFPEIIWRTYEQIRFLLPPPKKSLSLSPHIHAFGRYTSQLSKPLASRYASGRFHTSSFVKCWIYILIKLDMFMPSPPFSFLEFGHLLHEEKGRWISNISIWQPLRVLPSQLLLLKALRWNVLNSVQDSEEIPEKMFVCGGCSIYSKNINGLSPDLYSVSLLHGNRQVNNIVALIWHQIVVVVTGPARRMCSVSKYFIRTTNMCLQGDTCSKIENSGRQASHLSHYYKNLWHCLLCLRMHIPVQSTVLLARGSIPIIRNTNDSGHGLTSIWVARAQVLVQSWNKNAQHRDWWLGQGQRIQSWTPYQQ